jgi:hypothetical protein
MQIDFLWQLCQENRLFLLAIEIIKLLVKTFLENIKNGLEIAKNILIMEDSPKPPLPLRL